MAENTLALLRYLSSPVSPLPSLTSGYSRPSTVYFSHLGHFFLYPFRTAKLLYGLLFFSSLVLVKLTFIEPGPALKRRRGVWAEQARGSIFIFAGIAGTFLASNIVAIIMRCMGKGMSWFSREFSPLVLYGPACLFGTCSFGYSFSVVSTQVTGQVPSLLNSCLVG
jgi:hypothetical protein